MGLGGSIVFNDTNASISFLVFFLLFSINVGLKILFNTDIALAPPIFFLTF